jgi:hypothetical protein
VAILNVDKLSVDWEDVGVVPMSDSPIITKPVLKGFLSDHSSSEEVVSIDTEPDTIYFEDARDSLNLNFDFVIRGLTGKTLELRFIKAAVYDVKGDLITFRHLNHNGVGTPSMHTIGKYTINGKETLDVFNPFHNFSKAISIGHLRYMFTLHEHETKREYYYGNVIVRPMEYRQKVRLTLPLKGLLVVLDGHDFYSHHRRFAMSIVRSFTKGRFVSNFSRYAVDFTLLGQDGNTRTLAKDEAESNYDFHFDDVSKFHTHGAPALSPADGEVVEVVSQLDDLYDALFDMEDAIGRDKVGEIAGNYIVIKHNGSEFSHLFHLMKDSILVAEGARVRQGQPIGRIGFSGASTTYSHLHYQLMDGQDFLQANPLPCKFSDVSLVLGSRKEHFEELTIDTGDFVVGNIPLS